MSQQNNTRLIAAQVVLNSSGLQLGRWVMEQFSAAGFRVGPLVGTSFSIEGAVEQFEEFFKVQAEQEGPQPFTVDELPLAALNTTIREHLATVLFTRPPDFGPGGHSSPHFFSA